MDKKGEKTREYEKNEKGERGEVEVYSWVRFRPSAPRVVQVDAEHSCLMFVAVSHDYYHKKHCVVQCHSLHRNSQVINECMPLLNQRQVQLVEVRKLIRVVYELAKRKVIPFLRRHI